MLTSARIADASRVHVIDAADVPNPNWLRPGAVGAGQQAFGDAMLKVHAVVLIPSVVSTDTRLHPPIRAGAWRRPVAARPFVTP